MSVTSHGVKLVGSWKSMGGWVKKFAHHSSSTNTEMKFSIFFPPSLTPTPGSLAPPARVPCIYWLSGLTCTDDNFMHKAGAAAFKAAAAANVAIVCPDTSPRGLNLPEEKNTAGTGVTWDFGEGAGFYVTATAPAFKANYDMYHYINLELPSVIASADLGVDAVERKSIMGHSMGGHGALVAFLRNPGSYASVSAFAPICHPTNCDWGKKAFAGYLGEEDKEAWKQWDSTALVSSYAGPSTTLLIDQGDADDFLAKGQLQPEKLKAAVEARNAAAPSKLAIDLRMREGYDHSYYFIQTFIEEHIEFHAKALHAKQ